MINQRSMWHLTMQPLLAMIFVFIVLLTLSQVAISPLLWAVGGSSLASSAFIVFGRPSSPSAQPWRVICGYAIGIIVGFGVRALFKPIHVFHVDFLSDPRFFMLALSAAIAVGVTFLFMILLNIKHPPAAGIALVLVINLQDYNVLYVIFLAAVVLALLRQGLNKFLCDLQ
jgi:CBS-domain-containing membrane protein